MALCGSTTKLETFLLIQTAVWPLSLQAATSVGGGEAVHNTMEIVSTLRGNHFLCGEPDMRCCGIEGDCLCVYN